MCAVLSLKYAGPCYAHMTARAAPWSAVLTVFTRAPLAVSTGAYQWHNAAMVLYAERSVPSELLRAPGGSGSDAENDRAAETHKWPVPSRTITAADPGGGCAALAGILSAGWDLARCSEQMPVGEAEGWRPSQ